ncbi:ABC transporter substrate-binding protein [Azospirillum brasilense]|nr:ABC transporter substrate-binding protein [Azospirillum brasilense]
MTGRATITRRHALGLAAGAGLLPRLGHAASGRRVAAIDWAGLETALALGIVPVAATELIQFRKTVVEPDVPESVIDLGLRGMPNYEALTLAEPDLILTSNYYEGERASLERVAETLSLPIYQPGAPPYPLAAEAALALGRALGREAEARAFVAGAEAEALDIPVTAMCSGMAVLGTNLSRRVLDAMSDAQFRSWSQRLVALTGTVYLGQGLFLLVVR